MSQSLYMNSELWWLEDYSGLSNFALFYQKTQFGDKLYMLGGMWSDPKFKFEGKVTGKQWFEYDFTSQLCSRLLEVLKVGNFDDPLEPSITAVSNAEGRKFVMASKTSGAAVWLEQDVDGSWMEKGSERVGDCSQVGTLFGGAAVSGDSLYFFGGFQSTGEQNHNYCSNDYNWDKQISGTKFLHEWRQNENWKYAAWPVAWDMKCRYGHGVASTTHQVFIFGGTHGNLDNTHPQIDEDIQYNPEPGSQAIMDNRIMIGPSEYLLWDAKISIEQNKMGVKNGAMNFQICLELI